MKYILSLGLAIACATALPARAPAPESSTTPREPVTKPNADDLFDAFFVPITRLAGSPADRPESTEVDPQGFSSYNPFNFFFRTPISFPSFPVILPDFRNLFREVALGPTSNPDTKQTNSTTETKMVNGHKVHVNKTFYENEKTGTKIQTIFVNFSPELQEGGEASQPPASNEEVTDAPEPTEEKKMDENEIREPLADHAEDNGEELSA